MKYYSELLNRISAAKKISLSSHVAPDADSVGSTLAMRLALQELGKHDLEVVVKDPIPNYLRFVSGAENWSQSGHYSGDLVIVLDCGDQKRVGDHLSPQLVAHKNIVNIDHHVSNNNFAGLNIVDVDCCSTCELLYKIFLDLGIKISSECATALLTGIYGDTSSFRNINTTPKVMRIAAELLDLGADRNLICRSLFESQSLARAKARAYVVNNASFGANNKLAWVVLDKELLAKMEIGIAETDGLAEELRSIDTVKISVIVRCDEEQWKVSMRAKGPELDLATVAMHFGGGGHRAAAAFRYRGALEPTLSELLAMLQKLL